MANDNATERVNSALAVLRSELSEIRDQDVQLMKQLLNINDSIKELSKKQTNPKRVRISKMGRRPLSTNMFISPELTTIDEGKYTTNSKLRY